MDFDKSVDYIIMSMYNGKVISLQDPTKLVQSLFNDSKGQKWNINQNGDSYWIETNGYCLTAGKAGQPITVSSYQDKSYQKWKVIPEKIEIPQLQIKSLIVEGYRIESLKNSSLAASINSTEDTVFLGADDEPNPLKHNWFLVPQPQFKPEIE